MNLLQLPTARLAACAALAFLPFLPACAADAPAASAAATPAPQPIWAPSDGANHPMGVGQGIFPGRVVWVRDLAATPWDGKTGNWWDEGTGISQPAVSKMFSRSLRTLAGAPSDAATWDAIFKYFNRTHRQSDAGYRAGEKIAVKINCNNAYEGYGDVDGQIDQSPQAVVAILQQLVVGAGVPQEMITVYEATRVVPDRVYKPAHAAFPGVRFVDSKGDGTNGRLPVEYQKGTLRYSVPDPKVGRDLPKCVVEATYLVNLTLLKGHPTTGASLTAKNHYGTVVGLDFIRAEFPFGRFTDFQPVKNADNYLHESALADHAPSGVRYAPDGELLKSLGVHEHWNNDSDRQYSRNLGGKEGIELVKLTAE